MNDLKIGDYIVSLTEFHPHRLIGTIHKVIEIKSQTFQYIDMNHKSKEANKSIVDDKVKKVTEIEVITAKILGKCYE